MFFNTKASFSKELSSYFLSNSLFSIPLKEKSKTCLFFYKKNWYLTISPSIKLNEINSNDIFKNPKILENKKATIIRFQTPPFISASVKNKLNKIELNFSYLDKSKISNKSKENVYHYQPQDLVIEHTVDDEKITIIPTDFECCGVRIKNDKLYSLPSSQGLAFVGDFKSIKVETMPFVPFFFKNYFNIKIDYKKFFTYLQKALKPYKDKDEITKAWFLTVTLNLTDALSTLENLKKRNQKIIENENYSTILGMLYLLKHSYEEALNALNQISNPKDEVEVLKSIVLGCMGYLEPMNHYKNQIRIMLDSYPKQLKNRLLLILIPLFAATNDKSNIDYFCSNYNSYDDFLKILAEVYYQMLRNILSPATSQNASLKYKKLENTHVLFPFANVIAAFQKTLIDLQLGYTDYQKAIAKLDRIKFTYKSESIEYSITSKLAELLYEKNEHLRCLKLLENMMKKYPIRARVENVIEKMEIILEKFMSSQKRKIRTIAGFESFHYLIRNNFLSNKMSLKIVDKLVDLNLLDQAADLLTKISNHETNHEIKTELMLKVANIHYQNSKYEFSLVTLSTIPLPISKKYNTQKTTLQAQCLYKLGKHKEAKNILRSTGEKNNLILLCDFLFIEKNWTELYEMLNFLKELTSTKEPFYKTILNNLEISSYLANKNLNNLPKNSFEKYIKLEKERKEENDSRKSLEINLKSADSLIASYNAKIGFEFLKKEEKEDNQGPL